LNSSHFGSNIIKPFWFKQLMLEIPRPFAPMCIIIYIEMLIDVAKPRKTHRVNMEMWGEAHKVDWDKGVA
jgi:hypothetical protein